MSALTRIPAGLLDALRKYQRQIDEDGTEVGVSRQAVDEAATLLESYEAALFVPSATRRQDAAQGVSGESMGGNGRTQDQREHEGPLAPDTLKQPGRRPQVGIEPEQRDGGDSASPDFPPAAAPVAPPEERDTEIERLRRERNRACEQHEIVASKLWDAEQKLAGKRGHPRSLNDTEFREAGFALAYLEGAVGSLGWPESDKKLAEIRQWFRKEDGQ